MMLVQPVVAVEEKELFAPEHAGESLAHDIGRVRTHRRRRDRLVKRIRFTHPLGEDLIEIPVKGIAHPVRRTAAEPQADHLGLTGADLEPAVCRDLGALLAGVHRLLPALYHAVVDAVLDVGALVRLPEKQRVVGFVLGEEQRHFTFAEKGEFTQQRVRRRDRARPGRGLDLLEGWFRGGSVGFGNPRRPVVAEPECRQKMQLGRIRSPIGGRDPHENVFGFALGVLHEDVEIPVVIEDAGVEELIFHLLPRPSAVCLYQVGIGKRRLGILVEVFHVGVGRGAVEVEVVLLHILAVVPLAVGQSEQPLLQDRVLPVPQGQAEAEALLVIGNTGDAVLPPAVGAGTGLIVGEEIPGVTVRAVVLPHRSPLTFAQVGPPLLPGGCIRSSFFKSGLFGIHRSSPSVTLSLRKYRMYPASCVEIRCQGQLILDPGNQQRTPAM